MKILRLDLLAFGPFSSRSLQTSDGEHGLHLVYGPNEAGKSSSLRALRNWLFGIPTNSSDNFLHAYSTMRIGGLIESAAGDRLEFIRRKGQKNTIREADDVTILDEARLTQMLAGVDASTFDRQYGITYEELRQGGQAIVRGGGDLGQILFAAGTGMADLGQVQKELIAEADHYFKKSGRNQQITQAISQLAEVRRTLKEATLPTAEWVKRDADLQAALSQQHMLEEKLKEKRMQSSRWDRILTALPLIGQRRSLLEHLAGLVDVPRLTADFTSIRSETTRKLDSQLQLEQSTIQTIAQLQQKITAANVPEELLRFRTLITELHTELGSIQKAAHDRPQLVNQQTGAERELLKILQELGHDQKLDQLEKLRLTKLQRQRIQSLAGDYRSLLDAQGAAHSRDQKLRKAIGKAEHKLAELPEKRDVAEIRKVLRKIQKSGELEQQRDVASNRLQILTAQTKVDLQKLPLWNGSLEELEALSIPAAETMDRFQHHLDECQTDLKRIFARVEEAVDQLKQVDQKLEQLRLEQDVPSEADLQKAREQRDAGWQLIRQALTEKREPDDNLTAEFISSITPGGGDLLQAFQISLEQADLLADRLRREADRVAEKSNLTADRQTAEDQKQKWTFALSAAQATWQQTENEWQQLWSALQIVPLSPREMRSWLTQQQKLAKAAAEIRTETTAITQLTARVQDFRKEILDVFPISERDGISPQATLSELLQLGEDFIEEVTAGNLKREKAESQLQDLQNDFAQAEEDSRTAQEALQKWSDDWTKAVSVMQLNKEATPGEATVVIEAIDQIFNLQKEAAGLKERVTGIDHDAESFQQRVTTLLEQVKPELLKQPAHQAIAELSAQLADATAAKAKQGEWLALLAKENEKQQECRNAIAHLQTRLNSLCEEAGCQTVEELPELERQSAQYFQFQQELESVNQQLTLQAGNVPLEDFIAEAESFDQDELHAQVQQQHDEIAELEATKTRIVQSVGEHSALLQQMNGGQLAALAQEQTEQLLARIRSDAEQFIRLRLASVLLQHTVNRFRESSQGPVLKRACELFSDLTLGAFSGLRPEYDEKGNAVLVGIRAADMREVHVEGMSEGTCDQLYLALRIALLEQSLLGREPIPFIVDDILVMFDDERASAALRALAQLSQKTQVIMFTHHEHVVQLAQNACDKEMLFVHSLTQAESS